MGGWGGGVRVFSTLEQWNSQVVLTTTKYFIHVAFVLFEFISAKQKDKKKKKRKKK